MGATAAQALGWGHGMAVADVQAAATMESKAVDHVHCPAIHLVHAPSRLLKSEKVVKARILAEG